VRGDIHERYYSFDSTAVPDGEYVIRITASDVPSNAPEDAPTASEGKRPFHDQRSSWAG
jgi:hypothetical protein